MPTIKYHKTFANSFSAAPEHNLVQYIGSVIQWYYRSLHKISTPLDRISKLDFSAGKAVTVSKLADLEPSRREFSEDVSFRLCILLVVD